VYTSRLNRIFGPPRARIPAPGGRRPGTAARQSQAQAEGRLRREAARVSCQWSPVLRLLSRGCAQGRRSSLGRGDHRGLCVGQFATGSPNVSEQNELARASGDWKSGHWARSPFARAGRRSLKHGPSLRQGRYRGEFFKLSGGPRHRGGLRERTAGLERAGVSGEGARINEPAR
jgi:hypothetical protein